MVPLTKQRLSKKCFNATGSTIWKDLHDQIMSWILCDDSLRPKTPGPIWNKWSAARHLSDRIQWVMEFLLAVQLITHENECWSAALNVPAIWNFSSSWEGRKGWCFQLPIPEERQCKKIANYHKITLISCFSSVMLLISLLDSRTNGVGS